MTLLNHEQVAQYQGFCYKEIVEDIGLQDEFKSITGEGIESYEYSPSKMSEDELVHRLIDEAEGEYVLYSDVVGPNEQIRYSILRISEY
jgi:hypothetical protein